MAPTRTPPLAEIPHPSVLLARLAVARSASPGVDAFIRRIAVGDIVEATLACGHPLPFHGLEDLGDDQRRRGDHRRTALRHQRRTGGAILNFNQYYISGPANLWATIVMTALVGILFFMAIVLSEYVLLRKRTAMRTLVLSVSLS